MDDQTGGIPSGRSRDRRMAAVLTKLERWQRVQEQRMSLGTAELRILWLFSDKRPRTLKQIAEQLRLEQSTVNRQVNAAVAGGLLDRARPAAGGAYEFTRTRQGQETFEQDVAVSLGALEAALTSMGPDAETFLALAERFVDAYTDVVRDGRDD